MSDNNNNDENIDEYYDYLPADHPLLRNVQIRMEEQLKKEEESLRLLHKEKSEEQKKTKREREDIGVKLYTFQQRYAKLEEAFTEKLDQYQILRTQRETSENRLEMEKNLYKEKTEGVKNQQKVWKQAEAELQQLNTMTKYVEEYNKQISGEIKVTTTNAQKVEKTIRQNERDKKDQDLLIDYLEEQIKTLTEKKYLYEGQLKAQLEETKDARENLSEALYEIQNIQESKRDLIKDWDKSLISMKTRDKTLQVVRDYIKEQDSERLKYTSQIFKYNDLIQNEVFTNNNLNFEIRKVAIKLSVVKNQINDLEKRKKKYEEKRLFLIKSINNTKSEIHGLEIKTTSLQNDLEIIDKNKLKLLDEARLLGEKNLIILSSKETHEKQAENLNKQNTKLEKEKFDIEVDINSKLNEIARVEIDKLNVEAQNTALKQRLEFMHKQITEKEKEYSQKESEIKQNHETLEKKQLNVDKLNKKFAEINAKNKGGEELGLYELKIKELTIELDKLAKQKSEIEQEWINKKSALVAKEKLKNELSEENTDMRHKKMILEHKKARLNKIYEMHEKEIREIEISLKNLGYDMNKYNGQLSKNIGTKDKIGFKFFDVEVDFRDKLKQLENQSVKLEMEIEVLREEKADTLTQILEVERQIHLWERKIILEEQMQEIVKPDKGIKEIDEMKSLIHRQNLLYKKLQQEQELVIKNMEMAIERRDFIKVRYPVDKYGFSNDNKKPSSSTGMTNQTNRELKNLKDDIKHLEKGKIEINNNLAILLENKVGFDEQLKQITEESNDLNERLRQGRSDYLRMKIQCNNLLCMTKVHQDSAKYLEEFKESKIKLKRKEEVIKEIEKSRTETQQIIEILRNYRDTHPEAMEFINELISLY
jgi:chromosome segregation ATPase